jgi:transposase-like protein
MSSERLRSKSEWHPGQAEVRCTMRRWTDEEKIEIVRQSEIPGSSVCMVSRRYYVNSNLIFNRRQVKRGLRGNGKAARPVPDFVPVTVIESSAPSPALPAPSLSRDEIAPEPQ